VNDISRSWGSNGDKTMTALDALMERLNKRGALPFEIREPANYDAFLILHEQFGDCPKADEAKAHWRARCVDTWSKLDAVLPGTFTGGRCGGQLVSGFGTLPLSPNIVYGHSLRMMKTLEAAATAYSQFLYSLDWMQKMPDVEYWAGSYRHGQRFVTLLQQRPLNATVSGQLEYYALRCFPLEKRQMAGGDTFLTKSSPEDEGLILPEHSMIYRYLSDAHPLLKEYHRVTKATIRCSLTDKPVALALIQESLPELTAINIFAAPWIFPIVKGSDVFSLYHRIRNIDKFVGKRLEIVLPAAVLPDSTPALDGIQIYFWALAPRMSVCALRQTFRSAFEHLLGKYSNEELRAFHHSLG
jgi:hypothetical protein